MVSAQYARNTTLLIAAEPLLGKAVQSWKQLKSIFHHGVRTHTQCQVSESHVGVRHEVSNEGLDLVLSARAAEDPIAGSIKGLALGLSKTRVSVTTPP